MLTSRVIWFIGECIFVVWIIWSLRRATEVTNSSTLLCPRCSYQLDGVGQGLCPECGRMWTTEGIRDHQRWLAIARLRGAVFVMTAVLGVFHVLMARNLLKIRRLLIIGDLAFIPGYSHFEPVDSTLVIPIGLAAMSCIACIMYAMSRYYRAMESIRRQTNPS